MFVLAVSILLSQAQDEAWRVAGRLLLAAEKSARTQKKERHGDDLIRIANIWRTKNPAKARKLLDEAWLIGTKAPDTWVQSRVIEAYSAIDIDKAQSLISLIINGENREFAKRLVARHVASTQPEPGVKLLNAIPNKQDRQDETLQVGYNLMYKDLNLTVHTIKRVEGINHDSVIGAVVANVADYDAEGALLISGQIESVNERQEALAAIVEKTVELRPEFGLKVLPMVTVPGPRAEALTYAADATYFSDRTTAEQMAAEAVKLIADFAVGSQDYWTGSRELLPRLARINTRGLRPVLNGYEAAAPDDRSNLMFLSGAWAAVDIERADELMKRARPNATKPPVYMSSLGPYFDFGYKQYLAALALQDPKRATALLKEAEKVGSIFRQPMGEHWPSVEATQILEMIDRHPEQRVRAFLAAYGKTRLTQTYEDELFGRRALANPAEAATWLSRMHNSFDIGIEDWNQPRVALRVARKLLPDVSKALKTVELIRNPGLRAEFVAHLGAIEYRTNKAAAIPLFLRAEKLLRLVPANARNYYRMDVAAAITGALSRERKMAAQSLQWSQR